MLSKYTNKYGPWAPIRKDMYFQCFVYIARDGIRGYAWTDYVVDTAIYQPAVNSQLIRELFRRGDLW